MSDCVDFKAIHPQLDPLCTRCNASEIEHERRRFRHEHVLRLMNEKRLQDERSSMIFKMIQDRRAFIESICEVLDTVDAGANNLTVRLSDNTRCQLHEFVKDLRSSYT